MASSDKPDFIEIDRKEAPVNLTTGVETGPELGAAAGAAEQAEGAMVAATQGASSSPDSDSQSPTSGETSTASPLLSQPNSCSQRPFHPKVNDDVLALRKRYMPPGNSMRKLPGGSVTFIGLLVVICLFGSQLEELRNRALTQLASGFAADGHGFVETVADLSNTYSQHGNLSAARQVLEKALSDLSSKGEDKGAKGAFVRLKLALLDFQSDNFNSAKSNAFKALDMLRAGGTYVPYETGFLLYEVAWQFDNYWDYTDGVLFHQKALDVWPKERPNYRSDVVADIGFEYNRLKRFDKAESAYKEALNQTLRTQGDSSSNVWRYAQLGQAQIGQKKYMEAEINLNAALGMENRLHRDRKTTHRAQIYTDLGRVKAARGDMKSAQDYFEKSEEILKRKKYESYYYLINQLELANLYRDTGHPEKARPLYGDLLRRLDAGDSGPDRKDVNRELDLLLAQTGGR